MERRELNALVSALPFVSRRDLGLVAVTVRTGASTKVYWRSRDAIERFKALTLLKE